MQSADYLWLSDNNSMWFFRPLWGLDPLRSPACSRLAPGATISRPLRGLYTDHCRGNVSRSLEATISRPLCGLVPGSPLTVEIYDALHQRERRQRRLAGDALEEKP